MKKDKTASPSAPNGRQSAARRAVGGFRGRELRFAVTAAILAALSIVLGKFAAIPIGDSIRISFENLPLILCSVLLGPIWGMGAAIVADLLGCVLRGYAIIPLITVAQAMIGLLPGVLTRFVFRRTTAPTVAISAAIAHIVCSMGLKTYALSATYGTPFFSLLPWRVLTYLAVGALEAYLCATLLRVGTIRREFGLPEKGQRSRREQDEKSSQKPRRDRKKNKAKKNGEPKRDAKKSGGDRRKRNERRREKNNRKTARRQNRAAGKR